MTDDVSIIEALGKPVRVTPGSYTNIKVECKTLYVHNIYKQAMHAVHKTCKYKGGNKTGSDAAPYRKCGGISCPLRDVPPWLETTRVFKA